MAGLSCQLPDKYNLGKLTSAILMPLRCATSCLISGRSYLADGPGLGSLQRELAKVLLDRYQESQLLELFAKAPLRIAYDCSQKRFRAQFLCALSRAAEAEAAPL